MECRYGSDRGVTRTGSEDDYGPYVAANCLTAWAARWKLSSFQAEDGIRHYKVTGVQTCALPILTTSYRSIAEAGTALPVALWTAVAPVTMTLRRIPWGVNNSIMPPDRPSTVPNRAYGVPLRSEERRVGKEGRSRWSPYHLQKKT